MVSANALALEPDVVGAVADAVASALGVRVNETQWSTLDALIARRCRAIKLASPREYAALVCGAGPSHPELALLARHVTVGETYFFRNGPHFEAMRQDVVPWLATRAVATGGVRVLSAGCSTGAELYSIAILLNEMAPAVAACAELVGVDVNPDAVAVARAARYGTWALRATPEPMVARWFREERGGHALLDGPKRRCRFVMDNLTDPRCIAYTAAPWDLILCRNTLMYFDPSTQEEVADRLSSRLTAGGFIFFGHAESALSHRAGLEVISRHRTFFSRRSGSEPEATSPSGRAASAGPSGRVALRGSSWWMARLEASCARAGELAQALVDEDVDWPPSSSDPPGTAEARQAEAAPNNLEQVRAHFRSERFADALRAHAALSPDEQRSARPWQVLSLVNSGATTQARTLLAGWVRDRPLDPVARCALAVIHESSGELSQAAEHLDRARYLDPSCGVVWMLQARVLERMDRPSEASRAFRVAADTLAQAAPERLELFAGGFGAEALVALCRARASQGAR